MKRAAPRIGVPARGLVGSLRALGPSAGLALLLVAVAGCSSVPDVPHVEVRNVVWGLHGLQCTASGATAVLAEYTLDNKGRADATNLTLLYKVYDANHTARLSGRGEPVPRLQASSAQRYTSLVALKPGCANMTGMNERYFVTFTAAPGNGLPTTLDVTMACTWAPTRDSAGPNVCMAR